MALKVLCVIPSRIGSTRLQRKPLSPLGDRTMIEWVYGAAKACLDIDKVIVATDSEEIAKLIEKRGGEVAMTDPAIATGSDRVAAVAKDHPNYNVVINLQGDEPFMRPDMLSTLIKPFKEGKNPAMSTLCFDLNFDKFYQSPDAVKVLVNKNKQALYFSRSPIPFLREDIKALPVYHHMGVYAYDSEFLQTYTQLEQTPFELAEKLEQLRALENGYAIDVEKITRNTLEINTEEELLAARKKIEEEGLVAFDA